MGIKQRVLGIVGDRLFAKGEILTVTDPAPDYRLIEIRSPAFWDRAWVPGAKIQINVGDWNVRTYTPVALDPKWGTLKILAYRHAPDNDPAAPGAPEAPGSRWAGQVFPGDPCRFIGPRASLRLSAAATPLIVFGDETVIPTAASYAVGGTAGRATEGAAEKLAHEVMQKVVQEVAHDTAEAGAGQGSITVHGVFTVRDPLQGAAVADALNLTHARFFTPGDHHAREALVSLARMHADAPIVLAGHAGSVSQMRSWLRDDGIPVSRLKIRIYWADGRTGLD